MANFGYESAAVIKETTVRSKLDWINEQVSCLNEKLELMDSLTCCLDLPMPANPTMSANQGKEPLPDLIERMEQTASRLRIMNEWAGGIITRLQRL